MSWTLSCTCNPEIKVDHVDQMLRHFETHHDSDKKGPKLAREMATAIFKFYQENPFASGDRLNILLDVTQVIKVEKIEGEEAKEQEFPPVDESLILKLTPEEERNLAFVIPEIKCEKQLLHWNPVDLTLGQTVEVGETSGQSTKEIKSEVQEEEMNEEQMYQLEHPDSSEGDVSLDSPTVPPWHLWYHTGNQHQLSENPPWGVNVRQFSHLQHFYQHVKDQQDFQL